MKDKREFWKTKTFVGAVAFAVLIVLQSANVQLPYEALFGLATTWTGYSVADRLRK